MRLRIRLCEKVRLTFYRQINLCKGIPDIIRSNSPHALTSLTTLCPSISAVKFSRRRSLAVRRANIPSTTEWALKLPSFLAFWRDSWTKGKVKLSHRVAKSCKLLMHERRSPSWESTRSVNARASALMFSKWQIFWSRGRRDEGGLGRIWRIWQYGRSGRRAVAYLPRYSNQEGDYKSLHIQIIGRKRGFRGRCFFPFVDLGAGPPAFSSEWIKSNNTLTKFWISLRLM